MWRVVRSARTHPLTHAHNPMIQTRGRVQMQTLTRVQACMHAKKYHPSHAHAHMCNTPHVEPRQRRRALLQQTRRRRRQPQPLFPRQIQLRQATPPHLPVCVCHACVHVCKCVRARAPGPRRLPVCAHVTESERAFVCARKCVSRCVRTCAYSPRDRKRQSPARCTHRHLGQPLEAVERREARRSRQPRPQQRVPGVPDAASTAGEIEEGGSRGEWGGVEEESRKGM
jgi:hypothetical protein